MLFYYVFFFFQAEDGIRDHCVTGVQTCALPISAHDGGRATGDSPRRPDHRRRRVVTEAGAAQPPGGAVSAARGLPDRARRSEERRVGKECRSRWSPDHEKKRKQKAENVGGRKRA